jgi:hypothetical protein
MSCLKPESHSNNWTTLVHVKDKIILVVVNIQNSLAKNQSNLWINVVARAPKACLVHFSFSGPQDYFFINWS